MSRFVNVGQLPVFIKEQKWSLDYIVYILTRIAVQPTILRRELHKYDFYANNPVVIVLYQYPLQHF